MIQPVNFSTNATSFGTGTSFQRVVPNNTGLGVRDSLDAINAMNELTAKNQFTAIQRELRNQQTLGAKLNYVV